MEEGLKKKAVIAMSGGVDSSVAAYLMKKKGFECVGMTFRTLGESNLPGEGTDEYIESANGKKYSCCAFQDVLDAKKVSNQLGFPHYLIDLCSEFEEMVIRRFADAYACGRTPNPCIDCNRFIKFTELYRQAEKIGFNWIVTGHYARIRYDEKTGRYLLKKGVDQTKDQSYVLYNLTQEQLSHVCFPLGEMSKSEVRELAGSLGLVNAAKHDSQDICFIKNGSYADFIESYTGRKYPAGDFVDLNGKVLGRHKGIIHYTIGQRKGLGLALPEPLYVCRIDAEKNQVILGRNEDLFTRELYAKDLNQISVPEIKGELRVLAKVRYHHAEQPAVVTQIDKSGIRVVFDEPQRAITAGQRVVLYDGDTVVGGAEITNLSPSCG